MSRSSFITKGSPKGWNALPSVLEHCESLRADTHEDNKIMQHLLEKNGFVRCGIIHVEDGTPRVAYQKLSATVHMQEE